MSNTRKSVSSDIQTLRSWFRNSACASFFNLFLSGWIADKTLFLVFVILLHKRVPHIQHSRVHQLLQNKGLLIYPPGDYTYLQLLPKTTRSIPTTSFCNWRNKQEDFKISSKPTGVSFSCFHRTGTSDVIQGERSRKQSGRWKVLRGSNYAAIYPLLFQSREKTQ